MSNKIVPNIYRKIIDDVMGNIQVDFEEYGMDEEVLMNLQAKWEAKLLETRVADFMTAPPRTPSPEPAPPGSFASISGSQGETQRAQGSGSGSGQAQGQGQGYGGQGDGAGAGAGPGPSTQAYGYTGAANANGGLSLPGQYQHQGNGNGSGHGQARGGGGGISFPGMNQGGGAYVKSEDDIMRIRGGAPFDDDIKVKPEPNAAGLLPGDDVIDSDLDDSDDELQGDVEGQDEAGEDIVFCVYDKVQRVKNKWKTTFKDGLVHINGRDYLFTKCTGEFEW